jgi:hypothetical protein
MNRPAGDNSAVTIGWDMSVSMKRVCRAPTE